jgi:predicted ferric reductase
MPRNMIAATAGRVAQFSHTTIEDGALHSSNPGKMKHIRWAFAALLGSLSALWVLSDGILRQPYEFYALRSALTQYSGVLGIGMMSVAMLLAMRPVVFESMLDGLDKMYRLHKWLGIAGAGFSVAHLLAVKAPDWMWWFNAPARPPRGARVAPTNSLLALLADQRDWAEAVGGVALAALAMLTVIALWKRFPYRWFFQTHRLLAIVYLVLVAHSVVLLKSTYWTTPIGLSLGILMLVGSASAGVSLLRRVGITHRATGTIESLVRHADNRVLSVSVMLQSRWTGHDAGQFAFVTFDRREGAHPFTISSPWTDDGRVQFLIKDLGDYTHALPSTAHVGDSVQVEGPYGRFTFDSPARSQIWVGGGIGIAAFIAELATRARTPDGKRVHLFYATREADAAFLQIIRDRAATAEVNLHVLVEDTDGRLSGDAIALAVPDWARGDIWFCGPVSFGKALRTYFIDRGLNPDDFHQELFDLR